VLDDAPQALIGDADDACRGQNRHIADQHDRDLFEQEDTSKNRWLCWDSADSLRRWRQGGGDGGAAWVL
jgi:hypothetical protein